MYTKEEKVRILLENAKAYFNRGHNIQYDQYAMDRSVRVTPRNSRFAPPEMATDQHMLFLDCSTFTYAVYFNTFGYQLESNLTWQIPYMMKPLVYDPYVSSEALKAFGATGVTLDDLLESADMVTLHLPLMESTKHMFNMELFKKMKRSAVLINTSRGAIVKEADLIDALEAGYLAGVGLDVFENESGGLDPRFLSLSNAVLTPHVAWNTGEATLAIHQEVTENVLRFIHGERPESIVNGL